MQYTLSLGAAGTAMALSSESMRCKLGWCIMCLDDWEEFDKLNLVLNLENFEKCIGYLASLREDEAISDLTVQS